MKADKDYPLLRASTACPLCHGPKDIGLVCCWHCYRAHGVKYGNDQVEERFRQAETALTITMSN